MKRTLSTTMRLSLLAVAIATPTWLALAASTSPARSDAAERTAAAPADVVARGKYLVTVAGCNDCHTPWKMGPDGPEPDMSRMLSGHPEQMELPAPPKLPDGPWIVSVARDQYRLVGTVGREFHREPDPRSPDWPRQVDVAGLCRDDPNRAAHGARPPDPSPHADQDVQKLHR